jgi:hypothetical protein
MPSKLPATPSANECDGETLTADSSGAAFGTDVADYVQDTMLLAVERAVRVEFERDPHGFPIPGVSSPSEILNDMKVSGPCFISPY